MTADDVPAFFYVRGERWTVHWRDHEDPFWQGQEAWGCAMHERREIHLDEHLRFLPGRLAAVWIHELLHASVPHKGIGRPARYDDALEEKVVTAIAENLSIVLNQVGWRRLA